MDKSVDINAIEKSNSEQVAADTSYMQDQHFNNWLSFVETRHKVHNQNNVQHISIDSFSKINKNVTISNVEHLRKRPYRTISHCGFLPPLQGMKPMDFHYPSLATKYLPLKRCYSTEELFSTPLYIPYPDQLVPKLLKYKKELQEKLRENRLLFEEQPEERLQFLANIQEQVDGIDPPAKRNRLNENISDDENVLIVQGILLDIMDNVCSDTAPADTISISAPVCGDLKDLQDLPLHQELISKKSLVLSRDARLQRKAQFMEFWQDNGGNGDDVLSSFSSVASAPHSQSISFNILTEREQKLLSEINESKLDQEEEIFAQIRDSLLSKVTCDELAVDCSWHEHDLSKTMSSPSSSFRTFVTSTPTNKHKASTLSNENRVSDATKSTACMRIIEPKSKNNLHALPFAMHAKNGGTAKQSKVNVKVNITKTRVVPTKKSFDNRPSRSGSSCGGSGHRRNFVLENIRKASMIKPKTVKPGAIAKEKVDSFRSILLPKNSVGCSEPNIVHTSKTNSVPMRSFMKAKLATGSPNLWITMKPNK